MIELRKNKLIEESVEFSKLVSNEFHSELYALTDGKMIGTYVEKIFHAYSVFANVVSKNVKNGSERSI